MVDAFLLHPSARSYPFRFIPHPSYILVLGFFLFCSWIECALVAIRRFRRNGSAKYGIVIVMNWECKEQSDL